MGRRDDHEEVAAWVRMNPTCRPGDIVREFGWPKTTAERWCDRMKRAPPPDIAVEVHPAGPATKAPKPPPAPKGAPVEQMEPDDREGVVATVRDTYALLRNMMGRLRAHVEGADPGVVPEVDRDTATALLALQRMSSGMISVHPGLMQMVKATTGEEEVTEDELKGILAALGV